MIRIAHLSDSHWDARGDVEDLKHVHDEFLVQARDAGVDLVVHAGDWFDRESTPEERVWLADWLAAAAARFPLVGVRGNHDAELDLELFNRIGPHVYILDRPEPLTVVTKSGPVRVLPLPWFDKHVVSASMPGATQHETRLATIDQARALLTGLRGDAEAHWNEAVVMVAHAMVQASEVAGGQVLMGRSVELTAEDLRLSGAQYVALGHVHKHQAWTVDAGGAPVVYSGSPSRHDHGEPEAKGWVLVQIDGRHVDWSFQRLPARELCHLEVDATRPELLEALRSGNVPGLAAAQARGARVRLRYRVAAEHLASVDGAVLECVLRDAGAHDVKLERQVSVTAAPRSIEVAQAASLHDKVQAYLESRGRSDAWPDVAPLLTEIEQEAARDAE